MIIKSHTQMSKLCKFLVAMTCDCHLDYSEALKFFTKAKKPHWILVRTSV